MKTATLTIRLDPDLRRSLARVSRRLRRTRSEVAREALRRQVRLLEVELVRARILPRAEARGYLTDDDVFDAIS